MSKIMGIDLGTSTTCVSVVNNGKPVVIPGVRGTMVTPSYVYVMEDGRILIGEKAKAEEIADPYNTVWATKRLIGRKYSEPEVQECLEKLSYRITQSKKGEVLVHGRGRTFSPIDVGSLILKFVARLATKHVGESMKKCVITVPASFNDLQRKATKMAGERTDLEVVRLVNEPTAAALAWGYHEESERTVAIYDLGGGTFDVSILSIGQGVYEVISTRGDSWLGGEDFDNRLVDDMVSQFKEKYDINIYNDKIAHQRVKTASEAAKIELSSKESTKIFVEKVCVDLHPTANVEVSYTRDQFESMVEDLVDKTIVTLEQTIKDAEMDRDELDNVILVGGMTRLPLVRKKIEEFLGREPDCSINPDEAVAMGAAIHAASLSGETLTLTPPAAARKAAGKGPPKKPTGEVAPSMVGQPFEESVGVVDDQEPVPMGEAEGEGVGFEEPAPVQVKAPLLIDVVSQSVGISDLAGLFVPLIRNNTKLPAKVSQVVTTCVDQQEAIRISVFQGEGKYVKDKVMLGEFVLKGIESARRGIPQVKVTFNIDQSGLFTVSAKDLKTNVEKEIQVEGLII